MRMVPVVCALLLLAPAPIRAQSSQGGERKAHASVADTTAVDTVTSASIAGTAAVDAPVPAPETPALFDRARADSSAALSIGSLVLPRVPRHYGVSTSLIFSMDHARNIDRLSGFERYRASRLECTYRGIGMGATFGMAAGAFGMMTGAWDERSAWYIAGATAALGALYGGAIKADDPEWNLRIRWEPDR